jgi:hypothetical protein
MKALGQDIFDFYSEDGSWPKGFYYDPPTDEPSSEITNDDGTIALDPNEKYDLGLFEYVCSEEDDDTVSVPSFAKMFRKWKDARTYMTVTLRIPKDQTDKVLEMLTSAGCKVSK